MTERWKANGKIAVCVSPSQRNCSRSLVSLVRYLHLEKVWLRDEVNITSAMEFVGETTEEMLFCTSLKNIVVLSGRPVLQMKTKSWRVLPGPCDKGMTLQ